MYKKENGCVVNVELVEVPFVCEDKNALDMKDKELSLWGKWGADNSSMNTAENQTIEEDNDFILVVVEEVDSIYWVKRELSGLEIWRMREFCCFC